MKPIRIGAIGLSHKGWGGMAHLPALKMLPQFEITAVATTKQSSADEVARAVGAGHAFDNADALIACADVDLVAILLNVRNHRAPALAAMKAGKMVLSEWPLGASLAEAREMAQAAEAAGVRNFVGLQGRSNPAASYVRDLVADGYVGEVLSTSIIGSAGTWGEEVGEASIRSLSADGGGTMLTISTGHTLDTVCAALGEFEDVTATIATLRKEVRIAETGQVLPKTAPDQIAITGRLKSGAVASVQYRAGMSRGTNFLWEINGTKGDILVTGPRGQLQYGEVKIQGGSGAGAPLADLPVPDKYYLTPGQAEPPFSVAYNYAQIAKDIETGSHNAPDFAHALKRHLLLDAIQKAADTGQRQTVKTA